MVKFRDIQDNSAASQQQQQQQQSSGGAAPQQFTADHQVGYSLLRGNMVMFSLLKVIGSYDSGAFSAAVGAENGIAHEWKLGTLEQGMLSASVFLGCIFGCPLAGYLYSRYSAKSVLVRSLLLHTLFTLCLASLTLYWIAILSRFLIGVTLSFIFIYVPIWVDEFSPRECQSLWMASHNAGVPIGVLVGYLCGAFFSSYTALGWEWAFYTKVMLTVPLLFHFVRVDSRSIDRHPSCRGGREASPTIDPAVGTATTSAPAPLSLDSEGIFTTGTVGSEGFRQTMRLLYVSSLQVLSSYAALLSNVEYTCSVLAMCSLYFVVSGIQNFVTQYLHNEPFNASMKVIMGGFGMALVTAPICGVITGGVLLDRIGGYQQNMKRVTIFITAWGAAAAFFSVICIFVRSTVSFLVSISFMLFCGGAIVPPGSGTVVACIPDRLRPAGAAFAQMVYNLLGNFSGPVFCGLVAQWMGDLKYGIHAVFSCSVIGLLPMLVLMWKVHRDPSLGFPADYSTQEDVEQCYVASEQASLVHIVNAPFVCEQETLRMHQGAEANALCNGVSEQY
ncbi:putative major facilitator superfamily sugar transporter [Trypanosoma vivax]|nr:transporter protein [Trypanosoma vivax]KAH8619600.1 putative major facilitator superfamily sugar transporter [Trypanosoma vivax]